MRILVGSSLTWQERDLLNGLLFQYHEAFALNDDETGLVKLEIDTSNACPKQQAPRRAPFALRQEIAKQFRPSSSDSLLF